MQVRREQSDATKETLKGLEVAIAEERLRQARAEADEAENHIGNQDRIERAEAQAAETIARTAGHENRRRWIWLAVIAAVTFWSVLVTLALLSVGVSGLLPGSTTALTSATSPGDDVGDGGPMTNSPAPAEEHLSSSKVQSEVELAIVKHLGKQLGVFLEKRKVDYHGAAMEIDGIDPDRTVFVEAFAHIGPYKSGQQAKVSSDALKFTSLRDDYPDARLILAFVDETAMHSVRGWRLAVLEHHGIERRVVPIPAALTQKLLRTQADQKTGMETG